MATANIQESLKAGVLADLKETWRQVVPTFQKQQELLVKQLPFSDIRNASYPFKESLPFVKVWNYGMPRQYQTFKDRVIQLNKTPYELTIPYSRYDQIDDQLKDMQEHVQSSVKRFAQLPDVLIAEYLNAVADLNISLANCYDGAGLFSATDGDGAARLGITGGNIITGSGISVPGVLHDIAMAQQRLLKMVDPTAGKPIFSPDEVEFSKLEIIGPNELNEIFQTASKAVMVRRDLTNNTSESNYMAGTFIPHFNPYLTDSSDWYVAVKHAYWRPFVFRGPKDIESVMSDISNSDRARELNEVALYSSIRCRLGPWFPGCVIKVNN